MPVSPRDWRWDNRCSPMAASDSSCAKVGERCFLPTTSSILAGEGRRGLSHPSHPASAQELVPQVPPPVPGLQGGTRVALPAFLAGRGHGTCVGLCCVGFVAVT